MTHNPALLRDIQLQLRDNRLRPVYDVATELHRVPNRTGRYEDLATVTGHDNLAQAIILRLLTPRGELATLGHPEYGSRVHELVGQKNTENTRNLLRLYILESLQREPRISQVAQVLVEADPVFGERVNVQLQVRPVESSSLVTIGPFTLELES